MVLSEHDEASFACFDLPALNSIHAAKRRIVFSAKDTRMHRPETYPPEKTASPNGRSICRVLKLVFAGMLCALPHLSTAQTATDAEEQRRRARQESEERLQRQHSPDIRLQSRAPAADLDAENLPKETPCFPLEAIRLEGTRLESFVWLQTELNRFTGQCIGWQGINQILQWASAKLIDKGFITTRLGIPEQDLAGRTLLLTLVPGVIRSIHVKDDATAGTTPARSVLSAFPVGPGDLLNLRDIEQGLEQMKRVPSQDVSIDIAPGSEPGESDIVLTIKRSQAWRFGFTLDDSGTRNTGRLQATATASVDNPLGLNDLLSVSVNNDADQAAGQHGTRGHNIQYSLPWGNWTLFLSDSYSHYLQTVQGANQRFHASGDSRNQETRIQRLLQRNQTCKTSLQFRLLTRESNSFIEDAEILTQRRQTTAAELGVIHRRYVGASQLDLTLAHRQGVPWLGGQSDAPGQSAQSPSFAYRLQTLDAALTTPFSVAGQPLRWISALRAQTTQNVLYATEFIAIGNRYTVRGFDGSVTLGAERGGYFRNELELPFAASGQAAYAAIDYGKVGGPSAGILAGRELAGGVGGVRGSYRQFYYDVFVGAPIRKPAGFATSGPVAGFLLSVQL